jgi:cell division cycle 20-like protein 1 (cofactor of APC complex)
VCGVKWSIDGNMIASGGNDKIVQIWDFRADQNICKFQEHVAAVKALAWSPHQNYILSTGGGSSDKTIRIWNTH